jgi:hypothetical protein
VARDKTSIFRFASTKWKLALAEGPVLSAQGESKILLGPISFQSNFQRTNPMLEL